MRLTSATVARASARRPWRVVGAWMVILVTSMGLAGALLGDSLTTDFSFTDNPESEQAQTLVAELRGETTIPELVVITSESDTVQDEVYGAYVTELHASLEGLIEDTEVTFVGSYLTESGPVSEDGRTVLLPVVVQTESFGVLQAIAQKIQAIIDESNVPEGFTVRTFGQGTLNEDFNRLAEDGLQRGETIGIAIALIILIVVFGAVVAAVVPIILAIVSIIVAFGLTALIGQVFELSFFVTNMITMIGLAVGIDYSLFVVSRYREERLRGYEKIAAIERAGGTASRAVFFSGLIVVLALSAMLIVPNSIFRSLGLGAITVVIAAVAAALTLLPAVLSIMGDRVNSLRVRKQPTDPDRKGTIWDRIGKGVMVRPWASLIVSVGVLLFLGSFYLRLDAGFAGVTTLPDETPSKQAYEMLTAADIPVGEGTPVDVVIDGQITPEVETAVADLQAAMAEMQFERDGALVPLFAPSNVQIADTRDLAVVSASLDADFQDDVSTDAVVTLRSGIVPKAFAGLNVAVLVGGGAAFNVDFFDDARAAQPVVFAWVLGLSFLLLLVVFRSLVIPLTSILMNLLSVGAAYGLLVLIFQNGEGSDPVLGIFRQVDAIEAWLPLMLFSILFGLSMDYQIFLLSRIKEHHDRTGDNTASVAHGLRTTGAIITGAALIMVAVFGGFALGELPALQQMGLGLAIAVLVDAFVVRTILVPSTMRILGERNWYFPSWLGWLPSFRFEAGSAAPAAELVPVEAVEPGP
ncbi:MAG TPA: MMPL family transporter [Candidatus Limnocylindrales bacterium]|nr:MMPL family transporter [Candidatus Limnocylindrales bacterium]